MKGVVAERANLREKSEQILTMLRRPSAESNALTAASALLLSCGALSLGFVLGALIYKDGEAPKENYNG